MNATTLVFLAAIAALAGAGWWALAVRRRDLWRRFARRHRLERVDSAVGRFFSGYDDGRAIEIGSAPEGSDDLTGAIEHTTIRTPLRGPLPAGLVIQRADGVVGTVQRSLATDPIPTDDRQFDAQFVARADDEQALRAYLTPRRRAALQGLLVESGRDVNVREGRLVIRDRELALSMDRLDQRWRTALAVALALDAESVSQATRKGAASR